MGYTALETMQQWNFENYKVEGRPAIPTLSAGKENTLCWCALTFLRENCEDLRFDPTAGGVAKTKRDRGNVVAVKDNIGKSYCKNQIPYHMQMDIDRLCLERTLGAFLASEDGGTTQKAYLVYFCYLEMFFGQDPEKLHEIICMLSDYENRLGPMVLQLRDHFVHSAYVFAMGLAIYQQSKRFRENYISHNHLNSEQEAAHHFLKYWGFTALFHDLGYPYELVYCLIEDNYEKPSIAPFYISFKKERKKNSKSPETTYAPLYRALLPDEFRPDGDEALSANAVFAAALTERLYNTFHICKDYKDYLDSKKDTDTKIAYYHYLKDSLDRKPSDPKSFGNEDRYDNGFMDHAYFSAYMLLHQLWSPETKAFPVDYMDALTAIVLHNSLFSRTILKDSKEVKSKDSKEVKSHPKLTSDLHPLAFLLMLCDELQCWGRFGYGMETQRKNHPIACDLIIKNDDIKGIFYFDIDQEHNFSGTFKKLFEDRPKTRFVIDIEGFLQIGGENELKLSMDYTFIKPLQQKGDELSNISLLKLYQLTTIINLEYRMRADYTDYHASRKESASTLSHRKELFNQLSLEYKLINLYQMQCYAKYLQRLHLFFTDQQLGLQECTQFDQEALYMITKWRHEDWSKAKKTMGWLFGNNYRQYGRTNNECSILRERLREHEYIDFPFSELSDDNKEKELIPIQQQQRLMLKLYNIHIYRL